MKTKILSVSKENITLVADALKQGEIVGIPTETVYGLAANALEEEAIKKIFIAKGRPSNNPLIVHVSSIQEAAALCYLNDDAKRLMEIFWPGPLTILLPKKASIPSIVNAGLSNLAVRMPKNQTTLELIRKCGFPLAAPSANLSGKPSATTAQHALEDFDGKIPYIIDGGSCSVGLESTVLQMSSKPYKILRPGGISYEMLLPYLPELEITDSVLSPLLDIEQAESPGMLYKHYSPAAELSLLHGTVKNNADYVRRIIQNGNYANKKLALLCFSEHLDYYPKNLCVSMGSKFDLDEFAKKLFFQLRKMDENKVDIIFCEDAPLDGIGLAIMNRLLRAAGFKVIYTDEKEA